MKYNVYTLVSNSSETLCARMYVYIEMYICVCICMHLSISIESAWMWEDAHASMHTNDKAREQMLTGDANSTGPWTTKDIEDP